MVLKAIEPFSYADFPLATSGWILWVCRAICRSRKGEDGAEMGHIGGDRLDVRGKRVKTCGVDVRVLRKWLKD